MTRFGKPYNVFKPQERIKEALESISMWRSDVKMFYKLMIYLMTKNLLMIIIKMNANIWEKFARFSEAEKIDKNPDEVFTFAEI